MTEQKQPLDLERDAALRQLAKQFSAEAAGQRLDVSIGAAALFIVIQCELAKNPEFTQYTVRRLKQVIEVLEGPAPP